MKLKKVALALAGFGALAFGIAACSKPTPAPAAAPAAESMPAEMPNSSMAEMPPASASATTTGPVQGIGTVTAIDAASGTVTIDHEAINAIPWPAMTMKFKAEDPMILKGIATGDHVAFELKSAKDTGIVAMIKKQ
jgi:Cu(I)/Ag(I) efflux system periplasmic protein CusF